MARQDVANTVESGLKRNIKKFVFLISVGSSFFYRFYRRLIPNHNGINKKKADFTVCTVATTSKLF